MGFTLDLSAHLTRRLGAVACSLPGYASLTPALPGAVCGSAVPFRLPARDAQHRTDMWALIPQVGLYSPISWKAIAILAYA